MAAWIANPDPILIPGDTYRIRSTVRGPYNAIVVGLMRAQFNFEAWVKGYQVVTVDSAPPLMSAHSGTFAPWTVVLTFKPRVPAATQAGIDPRAMLAIAGLVVAAALSLYLVESKLEKLVTTVGQEIVRPLVDPLKDLLSPGTLILAFSAFAIFFYFSRRAS